VPDYLIFAVVSVDVDRGFCIVYTGSHLTHIIYKVTARWCGGMQVKASERFQLSL